MGRAATGLVRHLRMPPAEALSRLRQRFSVHVGAWDEGRRTFLDTFDWRLYRSGARLTFEIFGHRRDLVWRRGDERLVLGGLDPPRFVDELPDSTLRRRLEPMVEVRALLPVGAQAVRRRRVRVLDAQGKTVVRVDLETTAVADPSGTASAPSTPSVTVEGLTGYPAAFEAVLACLAPEAEDASGALDPLFEAASAWGRRPGEVPTLSSLRLDPAEPAAAAVGRILRLLEAAITANVPAVMDDIDTECLHDLRVAVRRTRAVLRQLGDLLPPARVASLRDEFRFLGGVTGPCRDLDVFSLHITARLTPMEPAEAQALEPFLAHLASRRAAAHRELVSVLTSRRFERLMGSLRRMAAQAGRGASRPIGAVAGERIAKAYRRLRRRALAVGDGTDARLLHRLRIDAKRFRYLLEAFASLFPDETLRPVLTRLKALQDALGAVQDGVVARRRLATMAEEMAQAGTVPAATFLAMGRLAARFDAEAEGHLRQVTSLLAALTSDAIRRRVRTMAEPGKGSAP